MPSASTTGGNQRAGRSKRREDDNPVIENLHFLGIGINEYQSDDWPNLNNAVRDVRAIANLLQQDFGLSEELTTYLEDEAATRAGILRELDDLSRRVKPADSLIIYYAGHGHLITKNKNKRGFWVPANATVKGVHSFIRNSAVKELLADINSLHILLISDSCFSGSLFVRGQRSSKLTAAELHKLPSRWAICSGRHDETVADGLPGGHSPFAESILDVLSHTKQEYITTNFLYEQVRDQTRSNYDQIPDGGPLANAGHKRGEFVFLRTPKEDPDSERVAELEAELAKCDEQLLQKEFRKVKRRLRVLKEEIQEELQSEKAKSRLLAEVDQRIGFCENYRQYGEWYERLEERGLSRVKKQQKEKLNDYQEEQKKLLAELASLKKELTEAKAAEKAQRSQAQELKDLGKVQERAIMKLNAQLVSLEGQLVIAQAAEKEQRTRVQELEQSLKKLGEEGQTETPHRPEPLPNTPAVIKGILNNMILVKGGTFEMGDLFGEGIDNQKPVHVVTLRDFYMGIHAVTFAEYGRYCKATGAELPSDQGWGRGQRPVININWFEAVKYCNWLSEQAGRRPVYTIKGTEVSADWNAVGFRLPTEAEWEFAARGGGQIVRFGNGKDVANPSEINFDASTGSAFSKQGISRGETVMVGSLNSPNTLGLHDMSGNVWEWCWDWRGSYSASAKVQPTGPSSGHFRVLRGGSWSYDPQACRVAYRVSYLPSARYNHVGFRVVVSPSLV
ncbi:MAG: SUMF1/EgtB/PvdO family nonheme iron enzyme [Bacteroidota bacterium]